MDIGKDIQSCLDDLNNMTHTLAIKDINHAKARITDNNISMRSII